MPIIHELLSLYKEIIDLLPSILNVKVAFTELLYNKTAAHSINKNELLLDDSISLI